MISYSSCSLCLKSSMLSTQITSWREGLGLILRPACQVNVCETEDLYIALSAHVVIPYTKEGVDSLRIRPHTIRSKGSLQKIDVQLAPAPSEQGERSPPAGAILCVEKIPLGAKQIMDELSVLHKAICCPCC